jgi:hypothetical protein
MPKRGLAHSQRAMPEDGDTIRSSVPAQALPTRKAAGWMLQLLSGENRSEVSVRGEDDPVFAQRPCKDFLAACRLHSGCTDMDRVRSLSQKQVGQAGRAVHCRQKISSGTRKRQFPLHRRRRGEAQALANYLPSGDPGTRRQSQAPRFRPPAYGARWQQVFAGGAHMGLDPSALDQP